jgi:uncharacterized protein (DUF885 family)
VKSPRIIAIGLSAAVLLLFGYWAVRMVWLRPFNVDHFFERAYIEFLWSDPESLTLTGILEDYGLSGHESELTDVSPARTLELADIGRRNLSILENYDRDDLNPEQQVSFDVFRWFLRTGVAGEPYLFHDYPVTHISGPHIELPQFMMHSHPIEKEGDAGNYLKRLTHFGTKFGQTIDALTHRKDSGIVAPTFILQKAIRQCDEFIAIPIDENPLLTSFVKKLNKIEGINETRKAELAAECRQHIIDHVHPAFKRLSAFMAALEAQSMSIAGVWHLPDGDGYYRYCLLQQTTLPIDPEEMYAFGRMEMSRIEGEMRILLNMLRFPEDMPIREILGKLEEDPSKTFRPDSMGRQECLNHFRKNIDIIQSRLEQQFHDLPKSPLEIHEVPDYRAEGSPMAFYLPPKGQPLGAGRIFINTLKSNKLTYFLATTYAYHEGIPGHHLQKAIQVEMTSTPQFRRFLPFEAFSEGWAMYAEDLGHEMTGTTDPLDRLGQLQSDLFRTARMVTDIGIHHRKWMREQAISFMMENAGLSAQEAEDEVDRYIVWPGQGCAYKVGKMKFLELRNRYRSAKGADYDPRDLHQLLISSGAMPLEVLEMRVNMAIGQ